MFKNEFQGGPAFEIFSSHGTSSPLTNWKFLNKGFIGKTYEKDVKGYCYSCEKIGRMVLPKNDKQTAYLIQPFLAFQILLPLGQALSLELCITDLGQNHRRFFVSTAHRDVKVTALHVNLPLPSVKRGKWLNLCFDLVSLVSENFPGQAFRSLESVSISGTFRLRKVFTLKNMPFDTTGEYSAERASFQHAIEMIPRALQFPVGVEFDTIVIGMSRILNQVKTLSTGGSRHNLAQPSDFIETRTPARHMKQSGSQKSLIKSTSTGHQAKSTSLKDTGMNIGSFNLEGYIPDSSTSRKTLTPEIHHRTKPYNPSLYSSSENISALAEEEDRLPNEVAGTREPAMDKESTFQIKTNVPRETVDSRRESPTEQLQREIDELLRGHERLSDQIVKPDLVSTGIGPAESFDENHETYEKDAKELVANQEGEDAEMNQVTATLTDIFAQFRTDSVITLLESPEHPMNAQKDVFAARQESYPEEHQMASSPTRRMGTESERLSDEESLDLVFDVRLNCFYDPKTGKTYPLDDSDEETAPLTS